MPKRIARSSPSIIYHWYRDVCHYSPYASMIATLMQIEGHQSPRLSLVKAWHRSHYG